MNLRSLFPSKYVAASDLCGQDVTVVIVSIKVEKVGSDEEQRPVLFFQGMTKGMVLNITNGKRIEKLYSSETDLWIGKPITLYPSEVDYGGETVPCIRVRATPPATSQVIQPAPIQVEQPLPSQLVPITGNATPRF